MASFEDIKVGAMLLFKNGAAHGLYDIDVVLTCAQDTTVPLNELAMEIKTLTLTFRPTHDLVEVSIQDYYICKESALPELLARDEPVREVNEGLLEAWIKLG